jgi:NAD(P)-dependent dehydrogenase (short-subunit alcohol dehydrogenase family)
MMMMMMMMMSLTGKNCVVTGGYGGIGKQIAINLAKLGANVEIIGRDESKCVLAVEEIKSSSVVSSTISYRVVDLSLQAKVLEYVEMYKNSGKKLNILVNNVVTAPKKRIETSEGVELVFATNVLGYVWMTEGFLDVLSANSEFGRVVNVESNYAGDLDLDDLLFVKRRYENHSAYRQSKQIGRMLTYYFAKTYSDRNCAFFSCHPGVVTTHLASDLGFQGSDTPEKASETPVWLASSPEIGLSSSGLFANHKKLTNCKFCDDLKKCAVLYHKCKSISDQIGSHDIRKSQNHKKSADDEKYKFE